MHFTILLALASLALAAPRPQDTEFDLVDSAPDAPIFAVPVTGTAQTVTLQDTAAAQTIGASVVTDVQSTTDKRDFLNHINKRDGDCSVQPQGHGPLTTPDTPADFLNNPIYQNIALRAATPQGYDCSFTNSFGSSQTTSWLGYMTMTTYDTIACAAYCDQHPQCSSFNIYFERDPTQDANKDNCSNPPSTVNIKCSRWGIQIQPETAVNVGQWRDSFQVKIAGSNGYNKNAAPPAQVGFEGPTELAGAINAPADPVTNTNTYMGYKFFSFAQVQTFAGGVTACTTACTAQTAYNSRHPPSTGNPNVCNQVVVYVLSDANQPQGIYCAMYSEVWHSRYATNIGQYRSGDWYGVSQAYAFSNATYSAKYDPICAVGGCPDGSYKGGNNGGWGPQV